MPEARELLAKHGIKGIRNGSLSLPQLTALATALGATVESYDFGDCRECHVVLPEAHRWGAYGGDLHSLYAIADDREQKPYRPSYNDLANRMVDGPVHCEEECSCGWDLPPGVT